MLKFWMFSFVHNWNISKVCIMCVTSVDLWWTYMNILCVNFHSLNFVHILLVKSTQIIFPIALSDEAM